MKASFYDLKLKKKTVTEVSEKVVLGKPGKERYAFKGFTDDGRPLMRFVSKKEYDSADI